MDTCEFAFERVDGYFGDMTFSRQEMIELNKEFSKKLSEARRRTKPKACYCCGKETTGFCDSHTVPRYCLDNIGQKGIVVSSNAIIRGPQIGTSITKSNPGVKEAGTFNLICNDCDIKLFRDYENPENYCEGKSPSKRMLAQIAMKNYLKYISKRIIEIAVLEEDVSVPPRDYEMVKLQRNLANKLEVFRIDLDAYTREFEKAKKYLNTGVGKGYHLLFYTLLDYVAPIAVQAPVAVAIDVNGNVINDLYNRNLYKDFYDLHVCVFPQKDKTAVLLFEEEGCTIYRTFRRQLLNLDYEAQLGVINFIIFLYTEDYYLAKGIEEKIDLKDLKHVANITPGIHSKRRITSTGVMASEFSLSKWRSIPNLLSYEYRVR